MNGTDTMADRVLILGGGLAGVACAQKLGDEGIDVVLVDRNDYHQFQPLLYQVASSQLPAEDIARPHRVIFADYPTVTLVAGVTAVHPDRVEFDDKTTIPARTVVWGGGESGSAVAQTAGPVLGRGHARPAQPGVVGRADADGLSSGAGRGCAAELLRCARGSRARLPTVFGGRRRTAAPTPAASAARGNGGRRFG